MKNYCLTFLWLYTPLGIIVVILVIISTLLMHHRELIPLAAETTTTSSMPVCGAPLRATEQVATPPSVPQPPRPAPRQHRRMVVTAYCPCRECCGALAAGITASGHRIAPGERFVAAPPELAFGTIIHVPGYNGHSAVKVRDRGGAIQDDHLDVFFSSHKAAIEWGIRRLTVTIETPRPVAGTP